jgi:hypothetical protein
MSAFSFIARSENPVFDRLALAVLAAITGIAALTFRDYGLGWDDYTHAEYGNLLLGLFSSGFADQRVFAFVNLYMYGGGFDLVATLLAKVSPFDLFETRRLLGALLGIAGLYVTWRLGRRLGGPVAGLFALVLLALIPLYYGHMFMNPKDSPFAVAVAFLLLTLVRAFQEYPRPQSTTVVLFGLALGATIGSRVIGGMVGIYALAAALLLFALECRAHGSREAALRMVRFVAAMLPGLAIGYIVMGLLWPWSILDPLNPLRAVEYFSHFFEKPWQEMFDGAAVWVPDMPRSYVPTLFAVKLPEVVLLLGLLGIGGTAIALTRPAIPARQRAALLLVVVAAVLPIAAAVITRPAMYNGVRHFIFVTPAFAVLGALAGAWIFGSVREAGPRLRAAAAVATMAAFSLPVIEMVRLHPYQYAAFNRLSGGVQAAEERYMIDYWGLAFKQASEELRALLTARMETPGNGRRWKIAVCGPHHPAAVELGPEFETTYDTKGADFALMSGEFYCNEYRAPVLVQVEREGIVFAKVYDIRNRSVSGVFKR